MEHFQSEEIRKNLCTGKAVIIDRTITASNPDRFKAVVIGTRKVPLRDMIADIDELQPELANDSALLVQYERFDTHKRG